MTNDEKVYMLIGYRIKAYREYSRSNNIDIDVAKQICVAQHKLHAVEWACDPEIKEILQGMFDEQLMLAHHSMRLIVGCLKSTMAGERADTSEYLPLIAADVAEAKALLGEGDG